MHIAAIYNLPDHKNDLAEALAAALGITVYEAHSRLRFPGKGPLVAASCRDLEDVERITGDWFQGALMLLCFTMMKLIQSLRSSL